MSTGTGFHETPVKHKKLDVTLCGSRMLVNIVGRRKSVVETSGIYSSMDRADVDALIVNDAKNVLRSLRMWHNEQAGLRPARLFFRYKSTARRWTVYRLTVWCI